MTKAEFQAGYALLTVQPWGKMYRGNTPEATIQAELYYRHVNQANPHVWQAICEANATGEKWPSLADLKTALQANGGYVQEQQAAIEGPGIWDWSEAPEPLDSIFSYAKANDCPVTQAMCKILPVWIKDNQRHEDVGRARALLASASRAPQVAAGNVRVPL